MRYFMPDYSIYTLWKKTKLPFIMVYALVPNTILIFMLIQMSVNEDYQINTFILAFIVLMYMIIVMLVFFNKIVPIRDSAQYLYVKDDHCIWRVNMNLLNAMVEERLFPRFKSANYKTLHQLNDEQWNVIFDAFQSQYQLANHDYLKAQFYNRQAQRNQKFNGHRGDVMLLPMYDLIVEKEGDWTWKCRYHDFDGSVHNVTIAKAYENFMPEGAENGFVLGNAYLRYHIIVMLSSIVLSALLIIQML